MYKKLSNTVKQSKITGTCVTFRYGLIGLYFMGIYFPDYL